MRQLIDKLYIFYLRLIFTVFIRLVDPIKKKVYGLITAGNVVVQSSGQTCFSFWERGKACENCISMRSCLSKSSIVKIEDKNGRLLLISAIPVEIKNETLIFELIKDITNSRIVEIAGLDEDMIKKIISSRNSLVIKDALTKLYNESFIYERLPYNIHTSEIHSTDIALFRIKIRNMDEINERFSFSVGNQVIKEISDCIRRFPRGNEDWASRLGGTEFILVIHGLNESQAKRIRLKIFKAISQLALMQENKTVTIDLKIGFYILNNQTITPEEFLKKAEINMQSENEPKNDLDVTSRNEELLRKYNLTVRELEVAQLLLKGKSNTEIAELLYIGLSTVKKHISSILYKTNVSKRSALFAKITEK